MKAIKATVMQGRIELSAPLDWPDGTEVVIEPTTAPIEKIGIDESQWRNDPESLADWEAWLKTIEPIAPTERDHLRLLAELRHSKRRGESGWLAAEPKATPRCRGP